MKWHLLGMFLTETGMGRVAIACKELAALKRHRAEINGFRAVGGALPASLKQNRQETLVEIEKRWYGRAIQKSGLRAGVTDLISFLEARDISQVVISDFEAAYKLEALGLQGRFRSTYVGERLGSVKPSPVGFQRAAADFGVATADLLHLGDREDRDDAAARAAGCKCLILGRDFRSFDALLEKFQTIDQTGVR
jgi:HAD superfamily hydrolase (TIGR01549 family)